MVVSPKTTATSALRINSLSNLLRWQPRLPRRGTLQPNDELISVIRELKVQSNGKLRVYAMSNISAPDYEVLRTKPADWSIFDQVFTSSAAGARKPNLGFFRHVLDSTHSVPQSTIFVDDKLENILSARSLGLTGVIFDGTSQVSRTLRNLIGDPVKRGRAFLDANAKNLKSTTDRNVSLDENFTQLLILEATNKRYVSMAPMSMRAFLLNLNFRDLVTLGEHSRTWNFFIGQRLLALQLALILIFAFP